MPLKPTGSFSKAATPKLASNATSISRAQAVPVKAKSTASNSRAVAVQTTRPLLQVSVPADEQEIPALPPRQLRKLHSLFGARSEVILDMLDQGSQDAASTLITKTMLQTLVDVLPTIERTVRKTKGYRGVYQLNQTISQMREVCNDLRMFKDRAMVGENMVERYIRPTYLDLSVQLTTLFLEMENSAKLRMDKEAFKDFQINTITPLRSNLANFMLKQYEELRTNLIRSLQ